MKLILSLLAVGMLAGFVTADAKEAAVFGEDRIQDLKVFSSGFVGCLPSNITISNTERHEIAVETWRATCGSKSFICMRNGTAFLNCAPALQ